MPLDNNDCRVRLLRREQSDVENPERNTRKKKMDGTRITIVLLFPTINLLLGGLRVGVIQNCPSGCLKHRGTRNRIDLEEDERMNVRVQEDPLILNKVLNKTKTLIHLYEDEINAT